MEALLYRHEAGLIPMGRRGGLRPRAMSRGWGQCPDYPIGPRIPVLNWQVVVELHVYVSRAMLIKYEPTRSNSALLQASE